MNWLLTLLSAALLILIFPGADLVWIAPVALTPLLIVAGRERRAARRFLYGWTAGIVFWFGVCYWIQFVLEVHGGMGRWGGWATFILFCLAKALHLGVFTWVAGYLIHRWYAIPATAALWTGIERTHGPLGFAWLALGNAGIDMPVPLRLAPLVGVYGLSFVFAMTAAALALVLLRRARRELAWLAPLAGLLALPRIPSPGVGADTAIVVQPNMPEEAAWTPQSVRAMQRDLETRSLAAAMRPGESRARLIVWPEAPGPLYYYTDPVFRASATDLARIAQTYFLFGAVAYTTQGSPLNSAVMLAPSGALIDRYDKMFLVPFGEFVPPMFSFVNRITKEAGDFAAGSRVVVFRFGEHRLGTFICYESAFPHLVRQFVRQGADVLANISNDGYFGRSAAREQHLKLVRMRAAENRRWIIRATNDGITAVIDPSGRVAERLPSYTEQVARMRFGYVSSATFYAMHGDWFAWSCLLAGLALALYSAVRTPTSSR
ncbi:MAG TPA: apolipoprotein N-acyltransferase [Bryobacteraceae bacterium]|nr:apolipoprotein N-acyltransferase [Bryobacteraceae bacterium]